MLLAAAVGTIQFRTLVEPIRKIIARLRGYYVQGKAVDLHMGEQLLEVETTMSNGKTQNIYIPYGVSFFVCFGSGLWTLIFEDTINWLLPVVLFRLHMVYLA